jgi:uncharacterized membrane protein
MTLWGTARTEAFFDGVIAIAITLLVLDIRVPPGDFDNRDRARRVGPRNRRIAEATRA